MLKLYSKRKIEKIIAGQAEWIVYLENLYGIPRAYPQAVLFKEMSEIDLMDILADFVVRCYWLKFSLISCVRRILKKPLLRHFPGGIIKKRDSSTGYAQIFAYVAIRAIHFSLETGMDRNLSALGMPCGHSLDENDPSDLCLVWRRLNRDVSFNLRMAALNLISAAEEMTGRIDFASYSPEEIQLIFTRYNANAHTITPYGRETYQYFLSFSGPSQPFRGSKAS